MTDLTVRLKRWASWAVMITFAAGGGELASDYARDRLGWETSPNVLTLLGAAAGLAGGFGLCRISRLIDDKTPLG